MSITEFITANISMELHPLLQVVILGIIWMVVYDFYHLLFSAVLSLFHKGK